MIRKEVYRNIFRGFILLGITCSVVICLTPFHSYSETEGPININTATMEELQSLPGIGKAYAERIIQYREDNNGFKNIEELMEVKGIGPKTFEKLSSLITTEGTVEKPESAKIKIVEDAKININTVSAADLMDALNLPENVALNVVKYREENGPFKKLDDLLNVEGIDERIFQTIEGDLTLEDKAKDTRGITTPVEPELKVVEEKQEGERKIVNINEGSLEEFMENLGINSILAQNIIDYRIEIGGFQAIKQLKEVDGITEKIFNDIKGYTTLEVIDPGEKKGIEVTDFEEGPEEIEETEEAPETEMLDMEEGEGQEEE